MSQFKTTKFSLQSFFKTILLKDMQFKRWNRLEIVFLMWDESSLHLRDMGQQKKNNRNNLDLLIYFVPHYSTNYAGRDRTGHDVKFPQISIPNNMKAQQQNFSNKIQINAIKRRIYIH